MAAVGNPVGFLQELRAPEARRARLRFAYSLRLVAFAPWFDIDFGVAGLPPDLLSRENMVLPGVLFHVEHELY